MRDRGREEDPDDREVTLGPATLLGIFLGLALVCGVFFGLGYSVGRRTVGDGNAAASADSDTQETGMPASRTVKPSAARTLDGDGATAVEDGSPSLTSAPSDTLLQPSGASAAPLPVSDTPAAVTSAPAVTAAQPGGLNPPPQPRGAEAPARGQTVVQVAAVVRQEDADVLVSALRQRGYRAMVRTEPQDKLLHVQVGPFSSRQEANAMKQKLLADGYNAIVK